MELDFIKNTRETSLDIEFVVKRIAFRDEDNGFSRLIVKAQKLPKSKKKRVEVLEVQGLFPMVYEGEVFHANGQVLDDFVRGPFFRIKGIPYLKQPQLEKEILLFFKKRVKGIGPKMSKQIIEHLGLDCLRRIQDNQDCLMAIPKMTKAKADQIHNDVITYQVFEELLLFLQRYHLEPRLANIIFQEFKSDSVIALKQDPYILLKVSNVKFIQADYLAFQLGWPYDHPKRIRQCILSYLTYRSESNGDMCVPIPTLENKLNSFLNFFGSYKGINHTISADKLHKALDYLISKNLVFKETMSETTSFLYSSFYHKIEEGIVSKLTEMVLGNQIPLASLDLIEKTINQLETSSYTPDPLQREAIIMALTSRISILTGGPGTGKTNTTEMISNVAEILSPGGKVLLLAPTGKAAKRLTELTKRPALTIHRAIGLRNDSSESKKEIEAILVVVDESSMVDAYLFNELLEAVKNPNIHVLLVGDVDQLPSVGPGLILRDLINSERIPVTRLTTIFRQAKDSQIVMNSYAAIQGNPERMTFDQQKGDFYMINSPSVYQCRENLLKSFKRMHEKYRYPISDICLLTPMKMGELGVESLNQAIQNIVNPAHALKKECLTPQDLLLREGDRVLHTINNDDLNVSNGEVGTIESILFENNKESVIYVKYLDKDNLVCYRGTAREELQLAYCLSIHKSQGSEFPVVITPIHSLHERMLNRNLIYTVWSRAKKIVICVGDMPTLFNAVKKGEDIKRLSQIREKLEKQIPA